MVSIKLTAWENSAILHASLIEKISQKIKKNTLYQA
jgi:hypothetical protein